MTNDWRDEISIRILWVLIKRAKGHTKVKNFLASRNDLEETFSNLCLALSFTKVQIKPEEYNEKVEEMFFYVGALLNQAGKKASRIRTILILSNAIGICLARAPLWVVCVESVLFCMIVIFSVIFIDRRLYESRLSKFTREWIKQEEQKVESNVLRLVINNNPTTNSLRVAP
jgi:hypothetical protein